MLNGTFLVQTIVILVNVKIATSTYNMTFWSLFIQFGSVASFYAVFGMQSSNFASINNLSGMFFVLIGFTT